MAKHITPLTDSKCSSAKPLDKDYSLYDGNGLILFVRKIGTKVWRYKYKKANGKDGLMTLGNFPSLTLKQARDKRCEYEKLIVQDIDPIEYEAIQKVKKVMRLALNQLLEIGTANIQRQVNRWSIPLQRH